MKYRMRWVAVRSGKIGRGLHYAKVRLPEGQRSQLRVYQDFYSVREELNSWKATRLKPSYKELSHHPTFEEARQAAEDDYLQVILEKL